MTVDGTVNKMLSEAERSSLPGGLNPESEATVCRVADETMNKAISGAEQSSLPNGPNPESATAAMNKVVSGVEHSSSLPNPESATGAMNKVISGAENSCRARDAAMRKVASSSLPNGLNPEGANARVNRARAFFAGKGATARMAKYQLPGDDILIQECEFQTNKAPLIFFPAFILLLVSDGIGYHQETPTLWRNGTLYHGPEEGIDGSNKRLLSISKGVAPNEKRTDRDNLYFPPSGAPAELICKYGNPVALWGPDKGFFCPMVFAQLGPIYTPAIWFSVFVLIFAYVCWKGRQQVRRQKHVDKSAIQHLTNENSWITHPVGTWIGFYENGYKDAHLHLWVFSICMIFLHSILARVFTRVRNRCLRFGDWSGHWDECMPLAPADVGLVNIAFMCIYMTWVGALWTVPKPFNGKRNSYDSLDGVDPVTRAAVKMKLLVHQQMDASARNAAKAPVTLMSAMAKVFMMAGQTDEVQEAVGDAVGDAQDAIAGALEAAQGDFIDGFADQLQMITDMANSAMEDGSESLAKASDLVGAEGAKIMKGGIDLGVTATISTGLPGSVDFVSDLEDQGKDIAIAKSQSVTDNAMTKVTSAAKDNINKLRDSAIAKMQAGMRSAQSHTKSFASSPTSLLDWKEKTKIIKKSPYFSASPGAILGALLGIGMCGLLMWAPQGAANPYKAQGDGFGKSSFCRDSKVWCNGQSIGRQGLVASVYYSPTWGNMVAGIQKEQVILSVLKLIICMAGGALYAIMLQFTLEPFTRAAKPLEVLGNLLSTWVREKQVTPNQLDSWILARRSFLHNECTLMLRENEKVVVFLILVMMILVLWQVAFVFMHNVISALLVVGIALTGFAGLTCIQAAIACYEKQQNHRVQLYNLKEVVMMGDKKVVKKIEAMIQNLETQDYQTKLMFLPLNPKVLKGIIGYLVTAGAAIISKFVIA